MSTMNVTIRMDRKLKEQADILFTELGMTTSGAFNIFVRQALREGGLPFAPSLHTPNPRTVAAMREAQALIEDPEAPRFTDVGELREALRG